MKIYARNLSTRSGANLSGVTGTVVQGPGGTVGLQDIFGDFYYFKNPATAYQFPVGSRLDVGNDYLSPYNPNIPGNGNPAIPEPGQEPYTLPGYYAPGPTSDHKWATIDKFAILGGLGALGLGYLLGNHYAKPAPASAPGSANGLSSRSNYAILT